MPPAARLRRIVTGKGGAKERTVEDHYERERDREKGTGGKRGKKRERVTGAGIKKARKRVRKEGRKEFGLRRRFVEDRERREDRRTSDPPVLEDLSRDPNRIESDRFRKRGAVRARRAEGGG